MRGGKGKEGEGKKWEREGRAREKIQQFIVSETKKDGYMR